MREGNLYMVIDAGPVGQGGVGGHAHNDTLSFELFYYDKSFVVDPGTYCYTGDQPARNMFRSSLFHNIMVVDQQEMARNNPHKIFALAGDADPVVHNWECNSHFDLFDGSHSGYSTSGHRMIVRRQIFFDKVNRFWIIRDSLYGSGKHECNLFYHFAPMVVLVNGPHPLTIQTRYGEGANLLVYPLVTKGLEVTMIDGWVSYGYGTRLKSVVLKHSRRDWCPVEFSTVLLPFHGELTPDRLLQVTLERARAILERFQATDAELCFV